MTNAKRRCPIAFSGCPNSSSRTEFLYKDSKNNGSKRNQIDTCMMMSILMSNKIVVLSYIRTYYLYHGNPNRRSIATSIAGASIEDGREREEIEVECAEVDTLNAAYVHCDYTLLQ